MLIKGGLRGVARSFTYAAKGIMYCIKNERNIRIHLSMAAIVSLFAYAYKVTQMECLTLLICFGAVISAEIVNTAIETLTNLESPSYNNLARIAKDVAAGAVLVMAITSAAIGCVIFFNIERLKATFLFFAAHPIYIACFLAVIVLGILFVFKGHTIIKEPAVRVFHMRNYDKK